MELGAWGAKAPTHNTIGEGNNALLSFEFNCSVSVGYILTYSSFYNIRPINVCDHILNQIFSQV